MTSDLENQRVIAWLRVRGSATHAGDCAVPVFVDSDASTIRIGAQNKPIRFDRVFDAAANQGQVFDCLQPYIRGVLQGQRCGVFAYGPTGSGKTYTIQGQDGGDHESRGLVHRALEMLFAAAPASASGGAVYMSIVQVYNNAATDLLTPKSQTGRALDVVKGNSGCFYVKDLTNRPVANVEAGMRMYKKRMAARVTASTGMNNTSSRSHVLLTLTTSTGGSLAIVDLAGSENAAAAAGSEERLKEGNEIRMDLHAIGQVVSRMADICEAEASFSGNSSSAPSYRGRRITELLQPFFRDGSTILIGTISPEPDHVRQTLATVQFVARARLITGGQHFIPQPSTASSGVVGGGYLAPTASFIARTGIISAAAGEAGAATARKAMKPWTPAAGHGLTARTVNQLNEITGTMPVAANKYVAATHGDTRRSLKFDEAVQSLPGAHSSATGPARLTAAVNHGNPPAVLPGWASRSGGGSTLNAAIRHANPALVQWCTRTQDSALIDLAACVDAEVREVIVLQCFTAVDKAFRMEPLNAFNAKLAFLQAVRRIESVTDAQLESYYVMAEDTYRTSTAAQVQPRSTSPSSSSSWTSRSSSGDGESASYIDDDVVAAAEHTIVAGGLIAAPTHLPLPLDTTSAGTVDVDGSGALVVASPSTAEAALEPDAAAEAALESDAAAEAALEPDAAAEAALEPNAAAEAAIEPAAALEPAAAAAAPPPLLVLCAGARLVLEGERNDQAYVLLVDDETAHLLWEGDGRRGVAQSISTANIVTDQLRVVAAPTPLFRLTGIIRMDGGGAPIPAPLHQVGDVVQDRHFRLSTVMALFWDNHGYFYFVLPHRKTPFKYETYPETGLSRPMNELGRRRQAHTMR